MLKIQIESDCNLSDTDPWARICSFIKDLREFVMLSDDNMTAGCFGRKSVLMAHQSRNSDLFSMDLHNYLGCCQCVIYLH